MAIRVGCPIALAKRANCSSCSVFFFIIKNKMQSYKKNLQILYYLFMTKYTIHGNCINSVELKCLVISRGIKVDRAVYRQHKNTARLNTSPLCCNCFLLSDGTVVQLTDTDFHLRHLSGIFNWSNIRLLKYMRDLSTPFSLRMQDGRAVLLYNDEEIDTVTFPPVSAFYRQKTASGCPFVGNAVLQGLEWVSFQCLWSCEYAAAGHSCQFCFSGGDFEAAAKKGKTLPQALPPSDLAEIVKYAINNDGVGNVQITGGSTFNGHAEAAHITKYLAAIGELQPRATGETLLYITPPADLSLIDRYFALGASRIACSLEVWDMTLAREITPGKVNITGRDKHLRVLEYIVKKYGHGKAFSNLIVGVEDFTTLAEGATWLAERGILPAPSVWMPMGKPVKGSMKAPDIDYYKRVKELFAELYTKYKLEPTPSKGLNVCVGRDIWNYATGDFEF